MNAQLINTAAKTVPNLPVLVNMMRLRVRQLCNGHRPLVVTLPGTGLADIALAEIIAGKLTFERELDDTVASAPVVVPFVNPKPAKKAA